jgi:dihydrofolate reductase
MRIVVNEFMSLDGVVQAPGGPEEDTDGGFAHGGWSMPYFDPEVMGPAIGGGMTTAEALLFGRRTWQGMAAAWPERAGDPYADQDERHREVRGVTDIDPRRPDVEHDVAVARARGHGHRGTARALAEGQVDVLNLMIEPILLGGGKRIFPEDGAALRMQLVQCVTTGTGVQMCTYHPA